MFNLLTGKAVNRTLPDPTPNSIVEDDWTPDAYLTAMRRLLNNAATATATGDGEATLMVESAKALAWAAIAADAIAPIVAAAKLPGDGDTVR